MNSFDELQSQEKEKIINKLDKLREKMSQAKSKIGNKEIQTNRAIGGSVDLLKFSPQPQNRSIKSKATIQTIVSPPLLVNLEPALPAPAGMVTPTKEQQNVNKISTHSSMPDLESSLSDGESLADDLEAQTAIDMDWTEDPLGHINKMIHPRKGNLIIVKTCTDLISAPLGDKLSDKTRDFREETRSNQDTTPIGSGEQSIITNSSRGTSAPKGEKSSTISQRKITDFFKFDNPPRPAFPPSPL